MRVVPPFLVPMWSTGTGMEEERGKGKREGNRREKRRDETRKEERTEFRRLQVSVVAGMTQIAHVAPALHHRLIVFANLVYL